MIKHIDSKRPVLGGSGPGVIRTLCGRELINGTGRDCKSCAKIYINQVADDVAEDQAGTWSPIELTPQGRAKVAEFLQTIAAGTPETPVEATQPDQTAKTWRRVAAPLDILTPAQRTMIGVSDGPVRFRARHGKHKASCHRRGW